MIETIEISVLTGTVPATGGVPAAGAAALAEGPCAPREALDLEIPEASF